MNASRSHNLTYKLNCDKILPIGKIWRPETAGVAFKRPKMLKNIIFWASNNLLNQAGIAGTAIELSVVSLIAWLTMPRNVEVRRRWADQHIGVRSCIQTFIDSYATRL